MTETANLLRARWREESSESDAERGHAFLAYCRAAALSSEGLPVSDSDDALRMGIDDYCLASALADWVSSKFFTSELQDWAAMVVARLPPHVRDWPARRLAARRTIWRFQQDSSARLEEEELSVLLAKGNAWAALALLRVMDLSAAKRLVDAAHEQQAYTRAQRHELRDALRGLETRGDV